MPKVTITIAFTGDVMLGRLVNEVIHSTSYDYPGGDTVAWLKKADLRIINLECAITESVLPFAKYPKAFYFRAEPDVVKTLKAANIDYCALANNHVLDFQENGLIDTLKILDENGIKHSGAGKNQAEAEKPAFLNANGISIVVISFTDNEPGFAVGDKSPGTNYVEISTSGKHFERVKSAVEAVRDKADVVILSLHWGPNMQKRPSRLFREFAHKVIDLGVDIIHGHSSHIFQGIEVYKGKLIMYDTGDFIDDYYVGLEEKNDQQLLFLATVSKKGVEKLEMVPVLIDKCQTNVAKGNIKEEICERMIELSREMGTTVGKTRYGSIIVI